MADLSCKTENKKNLANLSLARFYDDWAIRDLNDSKAQKNQSQPIENKELTGIPEKGKKCTPAGQFAGSLAIIDPDFEILKSRWTSLAESIKSEIMRLVKKCE